MRYSMQPSSTQLLDWHLKPRAVVCVMRCVCMISLGCLGYTRCAFEMCVAWPATVALAACKLNTVCFVPQRVQACRFCSCVVERRKAAM